MHKYVDEIEARIGICKAKERECERVESAVTAQIFGELAVNIHTCRSRAISEPPQGLAALRGIVCEHSHLSSVNVHSVKV